MSRIGKLFAFVLLAAVGSSAALAAVTTVQFQDADGYALSNTTITMVSADGKTTLNGNDSGAFEIDLEPGETVTFRTVNTYGEEETTFVVPAALNSTLIVTLPVSRATCDVGTPIAIGSTTAFDTTGAGVDAGAAFCGTALNTADALWFSFVGNGNDISASLCNAATAYDSKLGVFCDNCAAPICITGNDDFCGLQSEVNFATEAGANYFVIVTGFGASAGAGELELIDSGIASANPLDCGGTATGGCCLGDQCIETTEDDCNAVGGEYNGDDTDCSLVPSGEVDVVATPNAPIPDAGGGSLTDTVTVAADVVIADLDVDFVTDHTFIGDLEISITSPANTTVFLTYDGGANMCAGQDGADVIFNDEGLDDFDDGPACASGPPVVGDGPAPSGNLLSAFDGESTAGDWTITITDQFGADVGNLIQWSLHVDVGPLVGPCAGACCTDGPLLESDCIEVSRNACEADGGLFVGGSCADIADCVPLAVEFDSMAAIATREGVEISWTTSMEQDTVGFQVMRKTNGREKVAMVPVGPLHRSIGTGLNGGSYTQIDASAEAGTATQYFIREIDLYGRATDHGPVFVSRPNRVRPASRSAR